jgi:hypothetical protein
MRVIAREGESALTNEKFDSVVNAGLCAMDGRKNDMEGCGRQGCCESDSYELMLKS